MQLELVLAGEALATSLTGEGPLPGVSADVPVEVRHSSKLGLTICAGIRPDAVMNLKEYNCLNGNRDIAIAMSSSSRADTDWLEVSIGLIQYHCTGWRH